MPKLLTLQIPQCTTYAQYQKMSKIKPSEKFAQTSSELYVKHGLHWIDNKPKLNLPCNF
jgi:hypothetical protein